MSRKTDYEKLKQQVITRANYKCEYCLSPEITSTQAFEIEHIIPFSKKGKTILENLALSCSGCNKHKFTKTQAFDKISKTTVELFHPRKDNWTTHFSWDTDVTLIIGLTPIGRATIDALQLNRFQLIQLRTLLVEFQMHPPD